MNFPAASRGVDLIACSSAGNFVFEEELDDILENNAQAHWWDLPAGADSDHDKYTRKKQNLWR